MIARLDVCFGEDLVGFLEPRAASVFAFRYDAAWIRRPDAFAVSHSLPLDGSFDDHTAARFFGNLLPEGGVRTAICRRLGISEGNDFGLLEALGRDCAGALVLIPAGATRSRPEGYRRLEPRALRTMLDRGMVFPGVLDREVRLSLAGAQDKLAVRADRNRLELPTGDAASSHVLKLPSGDFAHLVANELFVMRLARAIDLPAARVALYSKAGVPAMLVERYDRVVERGRIRRLHQEDLCQSLGYDSRSKYESEGGPTFADCLRHVRARSDRPLEDTKALLRWLAFCVAVGNRDGHAKNLSMLRRDDGAWVLAPFYDLVCTLSYPRLTKRLAFSIGGSFDGGNLSTASFAREADRLEVRRSYLLDVVREVVRAVEDALPGVSKDVAAELGSRVPLDAPARAIRKASRAVLRGTA